jgi:hypothetical protein
MKKYLIILGFMIFSGTAQTPVENEFKKSVVKAKIVEPSQPVAVATLPPHRMPVARVPAQTTPVTIQPSRLDHLVQRDPAIKSPTGEWIATNITALPLSTYQPSFGKEIYRDAYFAYFEGKTEDSVPVAFNPVNQRFHPLSHILLLKKINEDLRREIIDEGHKEYYYNQRMGLLSIQSSSQEVLSLYSEFKKRGLDVRLEVLKESVQPR